MTTRDYDIVLYGASGFTGRQTVEYLARHAPPDLRWAIAGRSREKLERVRAEVGAPRTGDVLVADGLDQEAVDAITARTRVMLSTAGPFTLYGTPLVDACVRFGTHYVDITGETPWIRELIDRYHARAAADGTRIVPGCGFDSVPSDLGAFLAAREMRKSFGTPCAEVRAYFQMKGGINGGTIATMLNAAKSGRMASIADPFLLDPPDSPYRSQARASRDLRGVRFDEEIQAWVGPFVMAAINTRVVRRSAALFNEWNEPYGPSFSYRECTKYGSRAKATAATAGLGLFAAALARPLTRGVLERFLPKPGEGPSRQAIEGGWFKCELRALGPGRERLRVVMRHQGDPGNSATVRFVCESALALALDGDKLPGGHQRGGVLTPATALGDVLAKRLRAEGVTIDVGAE